ncbi:OadG family protein [Lamprobacter modestohalophilus]|uniref:OadG family protein n=1 Tax=Lamprobacter modestohalophilus TaxID=1064514 RepID=UPI002ADEDFAF|nr:OadG family protein [Lamprobacter modestohalophilus]MEA1049753.1 OadG family protein [Lamprobacter modestohalophilus]
MPETTLIADSLSLMAIGMGTVFSFLLLLVLLLKGMSWLAEKLAPGGVEPLLTPAQVSRNGQIADAELVAVISAAVARYRSHRRQ